jgi:hypothetical protein
MHWWPFCCWAGGNARHSQLHVFSLFGVPQPRSRVSTNQHAGAMSHSLLRLLEWDFMTS